MVCTPSKINIAKNKITVVILALPERRNVNPKTSQLESNFYHF